MIPQLFPRIVWLVVVPRKRVHFSPGWHTSIIRRFGSSGRRIIQFSLTAMSRMQCLHLLLVKGLCRRSTVGPVSRVIMGKQVGSTRRRKQVIVGIVFALKQSSQLSQRANRKNVNRTPECTITIKSSSLPGLGVDWSLGVGAGHTAGCQESECRQRVLALSTQFSYAKKMYQKKSVQLKGCV